MADGASRMTIVAEPAKFIKYLFKKALRRRIFPFGYSVHNNKAYT